MGRQREFDLDQTLDAIKQVFWEHGYEGASMARIEQATGLKKQSLYRAFGDKRAMYLAALRDYDRIELTAALRILRSAESVQKGVDALFASIIDQAYDGDDWRGCFLCNASVDQAPVDESSRIMVERMMSGIRRVLEAGLARDRLELSESELGTRASAILTTYFGLRVMIKGRQPRAELEACRRYSVQALV